MHFLKLYWNKYSILGQTAHIFKMAQKESAHRSIILEIEALSGRNGWDEAAQPYRKLWAQGEKERQTRATAGRERRRKVVGDGGGEKLWERKRFGGVWERETEREREIRASQIYQVFLSKEAVGGGDVWSSNSCYLYRKRESRSQAKWFQNSTACFTKWMLWISQARPVKKRQPHLYFWYFKHYHEQECTSDQHCENDISSIQEIKTE